MNKKVNPKGFGRQRRKKHIRKIVRGTPERPRLCVFRSATHIYVQLIDDVNGKTLASASSAGLELPEGARGSNREGAKAVGKAVAEKALANQLKSVVFDRNGYLYHGRIAALADAAREAGLKF
jgi:large subunit ribosomal protein L18